MPAPWMPSAGIGPKPKISSGEAGISTIAPTSVTMAGTLTLPEPRNAAACRLTIHTGMAPANKIVGIFQRGVERLVFAAERAVQQRPAPDRAQREDRAEDDGEDHGMEHQCVGVVLAAGTDRARHRRCHAAAEAAVRHHRHQHEHRKHHRDAGQRVGAEKSDIISLRDIDGGLGEQHDHGRQCQLQQRRQNRTRQDRRARPVVALAFRLGTDVNGRILFAGRRVEREGCSGCFQFHGSCLSAFFSLNYIHNALL